MYQRGLTMYDATEKSLNSLTNVTQPLGDHSASSLFGDGECLVVFVKQPQDCMLQLVIFFAKDQQP